MSEANEPIPEAELVEMHMDKSGLEFRLKHPIVPVMAQHLVEAFKAAGGVNYVSFEINTEDLGPLTMTMQKRWGKTPDALAHKYRDALEKIRDGGVDAAALAKAALA